MEAKREHREEAWAIVNHVEYGDMSIEPDEKHWVETGESPADERHERRFGLLRRVAHGLANAGEKIVTEILDKMKAEREAAGPAVVTRGHREFVIKMIRNAALATGEYPVLVEEISALERWAAGEPLDSDDDAEAAKAFEAMAQTLANGSLRP